MYYDQKQLERDLAMLFLTFGQRRQVGFYTQSFCNRNGLEIDQGLVGLGVGGYVVKFRGYEVDTAAIVVDSDVGNAILELVIDAEENTEFGRKMTQMSKAVFG